MNWKEFSQQAKTHNCMHSHLSEPRLLVLHQTRKTILFEEKQVEGFGHRTSRGSPRLNVLSPKFAYPTKIVKLRSLIPEFLRFIQLSFFNSNGALLSGDPLYVGFDLTIASFDSISEVSMVSAQFLIDTI